MSMCTKSHTTIKNCTVKLFQIYYQEKLQKFTFTQKNNSISGPSYKTNKTNLYQIVKTLITNISLPFRKTCLKCVAWHRISHTHQQYQTYCHCQGSHHRQTPHTSASLSCRNIGRKFHDSGQLNVAKNNDLETKKQKQTCMYEQRPCHQ